MTADPAGPADPTLVWVDGDGDTIHVHNDALPDGRAVLTLVEDGTSASVFLPRDPDELDALLGRIRRWALACEPAGCVGD